MHLLSGAATEARSWGHRDHRHDSQVGGPCPEEGMTRTTEAFREQLKLTTDPLHVVVLNLASFRLAEIVKN